MEQETDWKTVYHTKHIEKESATILKTHSTSPETNKTNNAPTLLEKENWTQQTQDINIETSSPDPSNLQFFDGLFNRKNLEIRRCDKFSENLHEIENDHFIEDSQKIDRVLKKGTKTDYVHYEVVLNPEENEESFQKKRLGVHVKDVLDMSGEVSGKSNYPYEEWTALKNRLLKEFESIREKGEKVKKVDKRLKPVTATQDNTWPRARKLSKTRPSLVEKNYFIEDSGAMCKKLEGRMEEKVKAIHDSVRDVFQKAKKQKDYQKESEDFSDKASNENNHWRNIDLKSDKAFLHSSGCRQEITFKTVYISAVSFMVNDDY